MNIRNLVNKIYLDRLIISIVIGGTAGFAYYYFIGCSSGSCAISSNPFISTFYGILLGGVLGFKRRRKKDNNETTK